MVSKQDAFFTRHGRLMSRWALGALSSLKLIFEVR